MRFGVLALGLVLSAAVPAYADVSFVSSPLWLSSETILEGQPVQVSTAVMKNGAEPVSGTVTFFANGATIGSSDFSMHGSVTGTVASVSWTPAPGSYRISAKITRVHTSSNDGPADTETSAAIEADETLTVRPDNDRDGISNDEDPDDDNDGISDAEELKAGTNPLQAETAAGAQVAGASTTAAGIATQAAEQAKSIGAAVFEKTEHLRERGAAYFDAKLSELHTESGTKPDTTNEDSEVKEIVVAEPVSFVDQVKEIPSFFPVVQSYLFKALSFMFNNIYAFYLIIIAFVLWLLRKIWRRHSLD